MSWWEVRQFRLGDLVGYLGDYFRVRSDMGEYRIFIPLRMYNMKILPLSLVLPVDTGEKC